MNISEQFKTIPSNILVLQIKCQPLVFSVGSHGTSDFGGGWSIFLHIFFEKLGFLSDFSRNYMKFDNSLMIEHKIVYLFPSNNII